MTLWGCPVRGAVSCVCVCLMLTYVAVSCAWLQLQAALQAASATEELKGALAVAEAEARAARAAEAQAKERSEFLLRQLQRLKQKMQEDQAAYRRSATAREAALKGEIQTLRERERAAKAAATQAEARAEELQRRMAQLERQQASLQAALGLAQERIAVFFRRAQEQELKEQRSKAALAEARRQVMRLGQQMSGLKSALSKPGPYDAQSSLGLMDDLKRMSLELMHRYLPHPCISDSGIRNSSALPNTSQSNGVLPHQLSWPPENLAKVTAQCWVGDVLCPHFVVSWMLMLWWAG